MIWIGTGDLPNPENGVNRVGSFLGPMGYGREEGKVEPGDLKTAQLYGQRIAQATHGWNTGQLALIN